MCARQRGSTLLGYVDDVHHYMHSMIDPHKFSHTTIRCIVSRESDVRPVCLQVRAPQGSDQPNINASYGDAQLAKRVTKCLEGQRILKASISKQDAHPLRRVCSAGVAGQRAGVAAAIARLGRKRHNSCALATVQRAITSNTPNFQRTAFLPAV